jgi:flavoprotein
MSNFNHFVFSFYSRNQFKETMKRMKEAKDELEQVSCLFILIEKLFRILRMFRYLDKVYQLLKSFKNRNKIAEKKDFFHCDYRYFKC